jgi:hypothetical protein
MIAEGIVRKIELTGYILCTQTEYALAKFKSTRQPTPCSGGIGCEQGVLGLDQGALTLKACE